MSARCNRCSQRFWGVKPADNMPHTLALSLLEDEEVGCMPLNAGPSLLCLPELSLLDLGTYPSLPVLVTGVPPMLPLCKRAQYE